MNQNHDFPIAGSLPLSLVAAQPSTAPSPWSRVGVADVVPLILRRWKGTLGVSAATLAVCLAATFVLPERYTATAQLSVDQRSAQLVGATDPMSSATMMATEIETQASVATSQSVLMDTIETLELWKLPEFAIGPSGLSSLASAVGLSEKDDVDWSKANSFADLPPEIRSMLVRKLEAQVSSHRVGLTSVVEVQATSADPRLASRIANALTQSYLNGQIESSADVAQRAADVLARRVQEIGQQVEQREAAVAAYLRANKIDATEAATQSNPQAFRLFKEVETSRNLYASYVKKYEDVRQQANVTLPNSRIIADAIVPIDPSFPPRSLFVLASLLLAAGAGLGSTILRESLVGGFSNEEQFELVTGREAIAMVPHSDQEKPCMEVCEENFGPFAESMRRLRVGVSSRIDKDAGIVLMTTSSDPAEGKSTLSMSLARAFAQTGFKTVIVDADLRRPTLSKMVGRGANAGMIDLFARKHGGHGEQKPLVATVPVGKAATLGFVGGGSGQAVATDSLVGSKRFAEFVEELRNEYDVVILDTPPINHVIDAKVIARLVDAAVYVVRHGGPSQRSVLTGLRTMAQSLGGKPLLPVLYGVKGSRMKRYGNYYSNVPADRA